jgi:hypothetical protein
MISGWVVARCLAYGLALGVIVQVNGGTTRKVMFCFAKKLIVANFFLNLNTRFSAKEIGAEVIKD